MENEIITTEQTTTQVPTPTGYQAGTSPEQLRQQRMIIIGIVVAVLVFLAIIVLITVALLRQDVETTSKIADVFIIFMALESLVIGLVLVILIVQLARLINLLQNEIKPIVESTNETVSTLRGTTQFLSDNISEPVIKLNEYLAGLSEFFRIVRPKRKKKQDQ
jgi:nitrogen fixation/metabolism regulation signal transduction histidine kinase